MSCSSCSFPERHPVITAAAVAAVFLTAAFLSHFVFKAAQGVPIGIGVVGFASVVFVALLLHRMSPKPPPAVVAGVPDERAVARPVQAPTACRLLDEIRAGRPDLAIGHVATDVRTHGAACLHAAILGYKADTRQAVQWLNLISALDTANPKLIDTEVEQGVTIRSIVEQSGDIMLCTTLEVENKSSILQSKRVKEAHQ